MDVSELGEFGLIERLTRLVAVESPDLIVGPGDDAAVFRSGDQFLIATTDTMVEGVHFDSLFGTWADVGWRALATNVSDIAAMGGTPTFALVTLALPKNTPVGAMDALYAGLGECARAYGVTIAGGDVVRADEVVITVALLGRAETLDGQPLLLRRSAACPGDAIAVTGTLGDSAAGLRRLQESAAMSDYARNRHLRPSPRVDAGQMAVRAGVRCGIDISDGLLQDVGHICEASGAGAILRASSIPLSDALRAAFPDEALELACTGGEDYELVLVGPRDLLAALAGVTVIGEVVAERGVRVLDDDGNEITFERPGWDAFHS
ncbi:MAG TPA: thiamine-phosphate kinase [Dehalococcoidia bacterium]|nr:thiamine-phosphate kinase [Dehalococcoidia bacterium]